MPDAEIRAGTLDRMLRVVNGRSIFELDVS
jgi:hypothetical protein